MRFLLILILFISVGNLSFGQSNAHKKPKSKATTSSLRKIDRKSLTTFLNNKNDTLYVVNFWATWCKPCVAELPAFVSAANHFKGKPVKFQLISLDFESEMQTKLIPFLARKKLGISSWLMTDLDYDAWINSVSKDWGGAIPATLIFNNAQGKRKFIGSELSFEELEVEIKALL